MTSEPARRAIRMCALQRRMRPTICLMASYRSFVAGAVSDAHGIRKIPLLQMVGGVVAETEGFEPSIPD